MSNNRVSGASYLVWKRLLPRRAGGESADPLSQASLSNAPAGANPDHATGTSHISPGDPAQSAIDDVQKQLLSSPSPPNQGQRSHDRRNDPLGLTVLHAPEQDHHSVDILFLHGLGGTSLRTWCWNRDLDFLWPKTWLPADADLSTARILTFGYNAHFSARQRTSLAIEDFANDLLFTMRYGGDGDTKMGQVPIIVVAHSLGGLVFKKAFVHGHVNEQYRKIVSSIKAVLFMATPHRGSDLARSLNRILSSSIFGHFPREYIAELAENSPTIDDLNKSFRQHAAKLHIFSFYETLGTSIGPVTTVVVGKKSALLGYQTDDYQNEISQPLIADHHDVCKFTSPEDPNYKSVLGALRSLVNMLRSSKAHDGDTEKELETVETWLSVTHPPDEDLVALRLLRKPGTCEDMVSTPEFETWYRSQSSHILWVSAAPGSGKSIQSSFVIDYLEERKARCLYWFFRYGDSEKSSLANMLRSIAYQMAAEDATYRRALVEFAKSGAQVEKADATTVWRSLFAPKLQLFDQKTYWVVDGLDESESSRVFLEFVSSIERVPCNIGMIIFSRPIPTIIQSVQRAKKKVELTELALPDNLKDIRLFLNDEMGDSFAADEDFKQHTVDQIAERSQGSFLWASLVAKRVVRCLRREDIRCLLQETPDGMVRLYHRMTDTIRNLNLDADKYLCQVLLSWAMYSSRPIAVEELTEPYAAELGTIINLKHTVSQICGQFVVINANNQLTLIHYTAREYLRSTTVLPFSLESSDVNEKLLLTCITTLCDSSLRSKLWRRKMPSFFAFASVFWGSHLDKCSVRSDPVLHSLFKFFNGDFPLPWIQYLAMSNQLSVLVSVSSSLSSFVRRLRKAAAVQPLTPDRLSGSAALERWAVDLLKMTAKFGSRLLEDPNAIYKCVPPLSPGNSILYQKYAKKPAAVVSVSGLSSSDWDDCLARVWNGSERALRIAVSEQYLAVASEAANGKDTVKLWNCVTFQEQPCFHHDDPICDIAFSPSGSRLACYGLDRTYVWSVEDRTLLASLERPNRERALALQFAPDESSLVVATDLRHVFRLNLNTKQSTWFRYPSPLLEETVIPEGTFISSPSSVAFNADCTQVAVAYSGFPLAVWSLDSSELIARNKRKRKQGQRQNPTPSPAWFGVRQVVWHPFDGNILGIYQEENLFKWNPMDGTHDEVERRLESAPWTICCSNSGLVFATADQLGSIRIYDYSQMVPIYHLTSNGIRYSIAFSPNGRRFYESMGTYCNVWEPDCLIRLVNGDPTEDSESVVISETERKANCLPQYDDARATSVPPFRACEAHSNSKQAITTVATCPDNPLLCAYAKDLETVEVYDMARNIRQVIDHFPFITRLRHIALSNSGDYIAYSTWDKITVKQLDLLSEPDKIIVSTCWTETKRSNREIRSSRGRLSQLLFDNSGKRLFVCSREKLQVLKLEDGSVIAEKTVEYTEPSAQWETSPSNHEVFLAFTGQDVRTYTWNELQLCHTLPIDRPEGTYDLSPEALLPSYHPRAQLLVTSFVEDSQKYHTFLLLDTAGLRDYSSPLTQGWREDKTTCDTPVIRSLQIPSNVARHIDQPLGVLRDGRLVFLDENLWVCTAHVWDDGGRVVLTRAGDSSSVTRHFFIPRDWLTSAESMLCRLQADGTLLCPSRGEIAVMRSDLGTEW